MKRGFAALWLVSCCAVLAWSLAGHWSFLHAWGGRYSLNIALDDGELQARLYTASRAWPDHYAGWQLVDGGIAPTPERPGYFGRLLGHFGCAFRRPSYSVTFPGWLLLLVFSAPVVLPEWRRRRARRRGFPINVDGEAAAESSKRHCAIP
jgi:hypothetical protein